MDLDEVMGKRTNHLVTNVLGWLTVAAMSVAAVVLVITSIRP